MWPLHTRNTKNTKNKQSEKGPGRGLSPLLVCLFVPVFMGWKIFSMGWGVGFSKWPKRVSDFSVKNQGEH